MMMMMMQDIECEYNAECRLNYTSYSAEKQTRREFGLEWDAPTSTSSTATPPPSFLPPPKGPEVETAG